MNTTHQVTSPAFQLKGSLLTVSILQLITPDFDTFQKQLAHIVQKTPNFFNNMPIVIDLKKIYSVDSNIIHFKEINSQLRQHGLIPIGITNGSEQQCQAAVAAGLAIVPNIKSSTTSSTTKASSQKKSESAKIITQPVRSGQQIYAKNGDLIILASVSNGAEIIASGNIHVYGALRGRALAGATGDTNTRIFCHKLEEAQLISIAGYYELDTHYPSGDCGLQIYLEGEQLNFAPI